MNTQISASMQKTGKDLITVSLEHVILHFPPEYRAEAKSQWA